MRALIIATSSKPPNVEQEIQLGQRPRLNYVELCRRIGAEASYVDYDLLRANYPQRMRRWEEKIRLDVFWALRLVAQINTQRYDVVVSMSERIGIPLGHLLGRKCRHVVLLHHPMSPNKLRLMKALRTPQRWDVMLPLSRAEAEALQKEFQLPPDRIRVQNEPVDTLFFKPLRVPADAASEPPSVFSIGVSKRDYPTLIRALRDLPHVPCTISATSAWDRYQSSDQQETMPDNVRFISYDHPHVIREAYARCRFVVVPLSKHTTQWSAGSVSILQPQAMGKPVIASHIPGASDHVLDGETGLLVEPGNPAAMAEAIDFLWRNPEKAEAMGCRAREWVEANFSLDKWLDTVRHVLAT